MTPKELAEKLNGRFYRSEIMTDEAEAAEASGLVVVFGHSDDYVCFRGAICDDYGAYEGTTVHLTSAGVLENKCLDCDCPYFAHEQKVAATIEAVWCAPDSPAWTFKTAIPHETFDVIDRDEDNAVCCRGIVFALADVKVAQ